jgi:hypothetical protein
MADGGSAEDVEDVVNDDEVQVAGIGIDLELWCGRTELWRDKGYDQDEV